MWHYIRICKKDVCLSRLNIQAVSATIPRKCKILGETSAQCQELKYKTPKSINKYIIHAKRIIL